MDCVQSFVDFLIVLFMDCVQSWSRHQNLQEDWLGTKVISISLCLLSLFAGIPLLGATGRNPGHSTKIARGLDGYTDISYCSLGLLMSSSIYVTLELQEDELVLLLIMILKSILYL